MKNLRITFVVLLAVTFVFTGSSLLGPDRSLAADTAPKVEVAGPVKMDKKATVMIQGTGFKPGEEITIVFTDKNGIQSDIGYALKPAPKADANGAWSTTWSCGVYIARKLVKAGESYRIEVTDVDYNPLAHTFISFAK
jgi:hypothetical protein